MFFELEAMVLGIYLGEIDFALFFLLTIMLNSRNGPPQTQTTKSRFIETSRLPPHFSLFLQTGAFWWIGVLSFGQKGARVVLLMGTKNSGV